MKRLRPYALAGAALAVGMAFAGEANAEPSRQDYRWFRALAIDLEGRVPTRSEIAAFEAPGFDADAWIDEKLTGPAYADRLLRIYMDALRLELSNIFLFRQGATNLHRFPVDVTMPGGTVKRTWVYSRYDQRRTIPERDREFCFTTAETGQTYSKNRPAVPEFPTKAVSLATMQAHAVKVRPWWLYRDYASASPKNHFRDWSVTEPRFAFSVTPEKSGPAASARDLRLLFDADGSPVDEVWVCKEEAQTAPVVKGSPRGVDVELSCTSESGFYYSAECGCGKGLEWCMPGADVNTDSRALVVATAAPLGLMDPFEKAQATITGWFKQVFTEEARHFLSSIFAEDADFRDVLTARYDWVNGPTAQFYRGMQGGNCCTDHIVFGDTTQYGRFYKPESLFDPSRVPAGLLPTEMDRWIKVDDRGPHAAGLLTLPAFLMKFNTRRGRANAVYNTFLCREFVAENLDLQPSNEPNLATRAGCSTCHAKLEPLAAYFTRTKENSLDFITGPLENPGCPLLPEGNMNATCARYYDPAFSTKTAGVLRGAYASKENAEKGPTGLAQDIVSSPDFATCATRTVVESMLGRRSDASDESMLAELDRLFVDGGFRMRPLVRAIVKSNAYRNANTLKTTALGGQR